MNKRMTLIITFYAVYFILWAIVGLAGNTILGYAAAAIIGSLLLIFCLFGWCTLSAIQPAMFIWMPLMGWIIYFFAKLALSYVVGGIVGPYMIGKAIADAMGE